MAKRKSFSINQSLSKSLEETVSAAHDFTGELFLDVVPVERLELDPENPRELHLEFKDILEGFDPKSANAAHKTKELAGLESLSKSIKKINGFNNSHGTN